MHSAWRYRAGTHTSFICCRVQHLYFNLLWNYFIWNSSISMDLSKPNRNTQKKLISKDLSCFGENRGGFIVCSQQKESIDTSNSTNNHSRCKTSKLWRKEEKTIGFRIASFCFGFTMRNTKFMCFFPLDWYQWRCCTLYRHHCFSSSSL